MNSVLTVGHPTTISHHAPPLSRAARRLGFALLAWSRRMQHNAPTREELAELHTRRVEADRLRTEHYRSVAVSRLI